MADFKLRQKTWVLLVDVDEYITFNNIEEDGDPEVPLDYAPEDVPTLSNWERKERRWWRRRSGRGEVVEEDGGGGGVAMTNSKLLGAGPHRWYLWRLLLFLCGQS
jgi:hypothetical protein